MTTTTERLARLSPEKRALLMRLLPSRAPQEELRRAPASRAQARLCVFQELVPDCPAYNLPIAFTVRGGLDLSALSGALDALVARHPALRTRVVHEDGQMFQVVDHPGPVEIIVTSPERALARSRRPFSLASDPLLRAAVASTQDDAHLVVISTHHSAADGSLPLLLQDLAALYTAHATGAPPRLPTLSATYEALARAEASMLKGPRRARLLEWWRRELEGAPTTVALPWDRPRPRRRSFSGARLRFEVSRATAERLTSVAAAEGATPFMAALGVLATLFARYSGQSDLLIGAPFDTRPSSDYAGVVGNFVNSLPLRLRLHDTPTYRALLRSTKRTVLGALAHAALPLEEIAATSYEASEEPAPYSVMLSLEHHRIPAFGAPSLDPVDVDLGTARLDLLFGLSVSESGWSGVVEYDTDRFDASTVERLASTFIRLADAAAFQPDARLATLPVHSPEALAALTAAPRGPEPTALLSDGFENAAASTPDAIAIVASDRTMTYGELELRSRALAHELRANGARTGELVAVMLEKGWRQVVAVLGILRAGAAYVPIDPSLPVARRESLLSRCEVRWAITPEHERFAPHPIRSFVIGERAPRAAAPLPRTTTTTRDLAYVIFTSGSTGTPKGVMIDHRGAVNTCDDVNRGFEIRASDRVFAVSSLSFDLSVWDIFGTLAAGATIVIPPPERDPACWVDVVERERVSVWSSVPALMELTVDHAETTVLDRGRAAQGRPEGGASVQAEGRNALVLETLRRVLLSGDWIPLSLPDRIRACAPNAQVISLGGATEASIWSIAHRIEHVDPSWTSVPYGRPLTNQTVYVLDQAFEVCAVGATGEIHIGGMGVALGYWRDPERTSAQFVEHPRTGERLYRTGDLGRYRANGELEILGRRDLQVKIRGFRIELGEVEAVLRKHDRVHEVAVTARRSEQDHHLVAYYVGSATADELRQHVQSLLPAHMEPRVFVRLEAFPLSSNGKVDRKALPAPRVAEGPRRAAPRNAIERRVAELWRELLECGPVAPTDDFFDLGGHSLLAVRLAGRLRSTFGVALSLGQLFRTPTVEAQSQLLMSGAPEWSPCVPLSTGTGRPLFIIHPIGGSVMCYRALASRLSLPVVGIEARGLTPGQTPHRCVREMAESYAQAIEVQQPEGEVRLAGWSMGGVIALETARRLEHRGRTVERVVLIDTHEPVSAATGVARSGFEEDWARVAGGVSSGLDPDSRALLESVYAHHFAALSAARIQFPRSALTQLDAQHGDGPRLDLHGLQHERSVLPGDHYSILEPPIVNALADRIEASFEVPARAEGKRQ